VEDTMKRRLLVIILTGCLIGLAPVQSADAAVARKWGQVLDSYGAKLFVCRLPEHTGLGTMWRYYVRSANHSRVKVRVSVRVSRWVFRQKRTFTKESWVRIVPRGGTTSVSSVRVWDHRASDGRFADFVTFRIGRPSSDGQVVEWVDMYPTGAPRCDLPIHATSWQGSGFVSRTQGRMQTCANKVLTGGVPTVHWQVRGDARHASRPLNYQTKVYRSSDLQIRRSWSSTIPPGGFTEPARLAQSVAPEAPTGQAENFDLAISEAGESSSDFGGAGDAKNVC
jgi:hypothetical protein